MKLASGVLRSPSQTHFFAVVAVASTPRLLLPTHQHPSFLFPSLFVRPIRNLSHSFYFPSTFNRSFSKTPQKVMDIYQQSNLSFVNQASSEQWWNKVREITQKAIKTGSIATLQTSQEYVEDNGVVWIIKVASSLNKKPTAQITTKFVNPFDEETMDHTLFVDSLFGTHNLLLNKFNVSPFHLLITTKSFQPQSDLLNQQDFKAIWFGVSTFNSLMFFNCGKNSGASQPHKHVQLIPLPLDPSQAETRSNVSGTNFPLEPLLQKSGADKPPGQLFHLQLPFKQAAIRLPQLSEISSILSSQTPLGDNSEWFQLLEKYYLNLYNQLDLHKASSEGENTSYNFLMTRNWMWMVPRSNEKYSQTISINSVGFAGTALVKSEQDLEMFKLVGPVEILKAVTFPL